MPFFSVTRSEYRVYLCEGSFDRCIKCCLFVRKESLSAQIRSVSTSMDVRRAPLRVACSTMTVSGTND